MIDERIVSVWVNLVIDKHTASSKWRLGNWSTHDTFLLPLKGNNHYSKLQLLLQGGRCASVLLSFVWLTKWQLWILSQWFMLRIGKREFQFKIFFIKSFDLIGDLAAGYAYISLLPVFCISKYMYYLFHKL